VVFVFGRKGCGKSRFVKGLAQKALDSGRTVLVWDPCDEFTFGGVDATDPVRGLRRYATTDNLGMRGALEVYLRAHIGKRPTSGAIAGPDWQFPAFCRFVMRHQDLLVIVDETDQFCSPSYAPKELKHLLRRGRHKSIDAIFVARAPAEIHRDITRQADIEVYFSISEKIDLDWVCKRVGSTFSDKVKALAPHRYEIRETDVPSEH
jgi:hypothetical protein